MVAVAALKVLLMLGIIIFAILTTISSVQVYKFADLHETHFPILISGGIFIIPSLTTLVGLYGSYHSHKPTLLIVSKR